LRSTSSFDSTDVGYYNAAVDVLDRNLAGNRRDRPYLIAPERTWGYAEVAETSASMGVGLLDLGLSAGDRVVMALRDSPEFVITFWGSMKAGLVPVPVAQGLSASDIRFILIDSHARAIVCDQSTAPEVVAAANGLPVRVLYVGDRRRDGMLPWGELCNRPTSVEFPQTHGDDAALWLYTSGTTGLPKAVVHRHRSLKEAPNGLCRQVIGMEEDDVVLSVSKMFFAYGLGNSVYLPASCGASVVINYGPAVPARVQELINQQRPTVLFGVPAFFEGFTRLSEAGQPSSIRIALSAGETLNRQLWERCQNRFRMPLLDGLGTTEALHHVTCNRAGEEIPGSAGRALDGYEIEVRDPEGQVLEEGESGELWIRGPTTFVGYWRRPDLTSRTRRDGWIRTGDRARVVDLALFHEGRLDDLIKLGGVWVSPLEIEEVLREHKDVSDAAIVARDEGMGVPILKAFLLTDRADSRLTKELSRLCRERLATFKVPQAFEVVSELPRTPTGKLQRYKLRQSSPDDVDDARQ
jgi:benzoate-CoA ligase family protein